MGSTVANLSPQSEFMVKLHECVRECSFEKPDEVVKYLFLTHNQNACVCEELLKSMKDSDGLNDILGYARLVEGTQHSESLSKAYLDTIKIPNSLVKVYAIVQKKNNHNKKFHSKRNGSKHRSQSKGGGNCHNCGTSHPQSVVQLTEKLVTIVIKQDTSSLFVGVASLASLVPDGREVRTKVNPGRPT